MRVVVYGVSRRDAGRRDAGWCREPTCGQWCTASPAGTLVGVGSLRVDSGVRRLPQGRWLV